MMQVGAEHLHKNRDTVNALNVFPVPDGDTGTNMSLTISLGVKEMRKRVDEGIGSMAEAFSKGLLMGARGNSGVILSQLFRGFAKALAGKETINARQFADAFYQGVETAYKAVIRPVEGTVLTVAREAADAGMKIAWSTQDPVEIMQTIYDHAKETLAKTPEMLSVLEETNVVDAGGQGLVFIYEGMLSALQGKEIEVPSDEPQQPVEFDHLTQQAHEQTDPSQIEYGYCTEFIIQLTTSRRPVKAFDQQKFQETLSQFGDSLLVVADEEWVKIHIHAERPGDVLNEAIQYGDLVKIKIDNMREQYKQVTEQKTQPSVKEKPKQEDETPKQPYGIVVVAAGEGNAQVFHSLGVDQVISGGQTMNPSTEEIAEAIQNLHADHVFVLPNNKNIILTAQQAAKLVDTSVTVLNTKTIPQGMAAMIGFDRQETPERNQEKMQEHIQGVQTGEVTRAVRDTQIHGLEIVQGDYIGLAEGEICFKGEKRFDVAERLINKLVTDDAEVITIIYGQDLNLQQVQEWVASLEEKYPDHEFEIHDGGQPLYDLLIGVE